MRRLRSSLSPVVLSALSMALLGNPAPVTAQSGGPYTLTWSTIDGGATFSTGGGYILGGTVGQADAGRAAGAGMTWNGGFWAGVVAPPSATPSPTLTATPSASETATATSSATVPPSATPSPNATPIPDPAATAVHTPTGTATSAATASATATATPTRTNTTTPTPSPSATPTCGGDCSGNQQVTVDEIVMMVDIGLGKGNIATCDAGDANHDGQITVDEILTAVNNALNGCGGSATRSSVQPAVSAVLALRHAVGVPHSFANTERQSRV